MTEILIAVIAGTPPTIAAVAAWRHAKQTSTEVQGNGHGTVSAMLEKLLVHQAETNATLKAHVADYRAHRD